GQSGGRNLLATRRITEARQTGDPELHSRRLSASPRSSGVSGLAEVITGSLGRARHHSGRGKPGVFLYHQIDSRVALRTEGTDPVAPPRLPDNEEEVRPLPAVRVSDRNFEGLALLSFDDAQPLRVVIAAQQVDVHRAGVVTPHPNRGRKPLRPGLRQRASERE